MPPELVFIDGLEVWLTRKAIKNMHLRVKPPDGRIEVSAPLHLPLATIRKFVGEKRDWIERQQREIAQSPRVEAAALLSYYKGRDAVCDLALEEVFVKHTGWYEKMPRPYFVDADKTLFEHFSDVTREGITIAAPGFYAPQGRWVRLEPHDARLNEKIESFGYEGRRITNFEMEGSALAGLAALMGHRAATICTIIAQRIAQDVNTDYKPFVRKMIETALDKLAILE